MTDNTSGTKKTNSNVTARSTSDPSGSQPISSHSKNPPSGSSTDNSTAAPLQPDPQYNDNENSGSQTPPSTSSTPPPPSGTTPPSNTQPPTVHTSPQGQNSAQPHPNAQTQSSSPYGGFDDWGFDDPFGDMGGGSGYGGYGTGSGGFGANPGGSSTFGGARGGAPTKRMTPEERVQMIERVYNEILQRKPDTRDINYYKYSTLSEEQVRKQLISSAEHTDMIKKGREYTDIKEQSEQLESRVRMLEGQIKDHVEEFRELSNLLQEKNRYIQHLRAGNTHLSPQPRKGPIPANQTAQPLPPEERIPIQSVPTTASQTSAPAQTTEMPHISSESPLPKQPTLREPSPLSPSTAKPNQPANQTTHAPQQAKPPVNLHIFTEEHGAPPPPDIETENGIITAEQNSLGRRIKQVLRNVLGPSF